MPVMGTPPNGDDQGRDVHRWARDLLDLARGLEEERGQQDYNDGVRDACKAFLGTKRGGGLTALGYLGGWQPKD